MPNILLLTRYDRLGASSRVRFLQFLDYLRGNGLTIDVAPFSNDAYVTALYAGCRLNPLQVLGFYLRRLTALLGCRRYDLVWMEKEALPWLPAWLEALLLARVPTVVDLDDAWFHRYDRNRLAILRRLMGGKIDAVMRRAAVVVAGNAYLAERAANAGARRIEVIPTVVDLSRYRTAASAPIVPSAADNPLVIGWIGQPLNAHYLTKIEPALRQVAEHRPIRLRVVGAAVPAAWTGLPAESRPWSEATEIAEIGHFDVGIMPLDDTPWERGKCAYKLLQVMAAGKPVVASPVGVNRHVVRHAINGFLADTTEAWVSALNALAADTETRRSMGTEARRTVEDEYSLERVAPRLLAVLQEAARNEVSRSGTPQSGEPGTHIP